MSNDEGGERDEHGRLSEEEVRGLLAEAAPREPMPSEVASRLDSVLADLVSERAGTEPHNVVPLPTRRRRWPQVLVAAAAVSVLGLGVGSLLGNGALTPTQEDSATAGAESGEDAAGESADERSDRPNALSEENADPGDGQAAPEPAQDGSVLRLRRRTLELDLQRAQDLALAEPLGRRWDTACVRPRTTAGDEWLPARLDGEPAVLVLRDARDGQRRAEVYTCGAPGTPAATGTVEVR